MLYISCISVEKMQNKKSVVFMGLLLELKEHGTQWVLYK